MWALKLNYGTDRINKRGPHSTRSSTCLRCTQTKSQSCRCSTACFCSGSHAGPVPQIAPMQTCKPCFLARAGSFALCRRNCRGCFVAEKVAVCWSELGTQNPTHPVLGGRISGWFSTGRPSTRPGFAAWLLHDTVARLFSNMGGTMQKQNPSALYGIVSGVCCTRWLSWTLSVLESLLDLKASNPGQG